MSSVIKSAEPCPICLLQNKVSNPLENRPGQFYSNCKAGHNFQDTEELNILRNQARAQYPALYAANAPVAPLTQTSFANQDIVITAEMKKTMEDVAGIKFTGASDLKGLLFALQQDNLDKDAEMRTMRASLATMRGRAGAGAKDGSLSPGQVVITIPEWALEGVSSQAEHTGMSIEEWVAQEVNGYFENYFGAAPGGKR